MTKHPDEALDKQAYAIVDRWHKRGYLNVPSRAMFDYEVAELIRKATEAATPRWIPVTEQLPEDNKDVLIFINGIHHVGSYSNGEWWSDSNVRWVGGTDLVTHWMLLPAPPKPEDTP